MFNTTQTNEWIGPKKHNIWGYPKKQKLKTISNDEASSRDVSEIENLAKGGPIAYADYYILNNGSMDEYRTNLEKFTNYVLDK